MTDRKLPSRRNPLLGPIEDEEDRQELIAKRRLGQTELAVDAGQVGTSNATKPKNLGPFDYAHIRVPLPKDLKGSGIFHASRGHSTPEAYFLMRRSSDGFVSASGLFKVSYPWASEAEESAEKAYLKSLPTVDKEEIAGNIWVPPQTALDLADDYQIRDWLLILLDPTPMPSSITSAKREIQAPPPFHLSSDDSQPKSQSPPAPAARSTRAKTPTLNGAILPPPDESSPKTKSPRKRALRSASPTKIPAPEQAMKTPRKIATPKRTKRGRPAAASASVEPEESATGTVTKTTRKTSGRQKALKEDEGTVKVDISSSTEALPNGDEAITTNVKIETPAKHANLKIPDDAQAYLDSAKKAIDEANRLTASRNETVRSRKRKAVEISRDEDEEEAAAENSKDAQAGAVEEEETAPLAKRVKITPVEERRDRIKKRATIGIGVGLAVG
ncbi:Start control protein cdc10 [Sphaceloma murrayae]|uniref:Start control protein cdc10 n=1 Tax=Sphaceloma murrayae TaxID=2082308 RepID=A0A2K1QTE0_9PEZI|nr:Start control protein cdc10 [Sphaceloma murrayae]